MSDTGVRVEGELGQKPRVTVPGGPAPEGLVIHRPGRGRAGLPGATVTTHYVGFGWGTGRRFDASWDRCQTISSRCRGIGSGEALVFVIDLEAARWQEPGRKPAFADATHRFPPDMEETCWRRPRPTP
jgi:hypothetical protein